MTSYRIERLEPSEAARLRAIRLAALRDAPDAFGGTLEESSSRPRSAWSAQLEALPTFVASAAGTDVGMARGGPAEQDPDAAFLLSMWVAPSARGAGVGEALIAAVVAWARAEGYARLLLDVGDENARAVALYARCGFVPTGEVSTLPPPRTHVREHRRVLHLA